MRGLERFYSRFGMAASTIGDLDAHSIFGLSRDDVRNVCRHDGTTQRDAWLGDARVKLLVSEALWKQYPQAPKGTLSERRQRYESNRTMSWYLREGTNIEEEYLPNANQFSDHDLGTIFEAMIQRATIAAREGVIVRYMQWVDARFNPGLIVGSTHTTSAQAYSQEDDARSLALLSEEGSEPEPEVRSVLSRMHNAFNLKEIEALIGHLHIHVQLSDATTRAVVELNRFIENSNPTAASNRDLIRELGGIEALVTLLSCPSTLPPPPYDWLETAANAAFMLRNLTHNNHRNQDAIREAKGVLPLVSLLSQGASQVVAHAADALGNLARNSHRVNQIAVREAGGIECLVGLLSAEPIGEVAVTAASALKQLAFSYHENRVAIHDAGGIQPFVALLHIRRDCEHDVAVLARTIGNVAHDNTVNQQAFHATSCVQLIVQLLCTNEDSWSQATLSIMADVLRRGFCACDEGNLASIGLPAALLGRFPPKVARKRERERG